MKEPKLGNQRETDQNISLLVFTAAWGTGSMDKIRAFLRYGYFPVQLPPGFTTNQFADKYKTLESQWTSNDAPTCRGERFSVARSSFNRRVTTVVNPAAYFLLVKEIAQHWPAIQRHYSKTSISRSRPKLEPSLRAIKITKFSDLYEARVNSSSGYKYALLTDVSRFFPTIYTHTIPWALHGRSVAKRNREKSTKFFGNIIDNRSMGVQDWQTMGLPIGPDTSHVIAEIVATAVDIELKNGLGKTPPGFRYVDDYCLFFDTRAEAERALKEVSRALTTYELQINPDKTKIIEVKDLVEQSWKYRVRELEVSERTSRQRDDIHRFFGNLFALEKRYGDESLIKYGLKKISTCIVKKTNWSLYEAYLLKCGYAFPNALQVLTTTLSTYQQYGYQFDRVALTRFCNNLIRDHAVSDGHSELAWALWLAKEMNLKIDTDSVQAVEASSSSVCKLILLDLASSGLARRIRKGSVSQYAIEAELNGDSWLLSYEGGRRSWLFNKNTDYIKNAPFFSDLINNDIGFYDREAKCSPVFKLKDTARSKVDLNSLFELEGEIDEYFEFADDVDEYLDSMEHDPCEVDFDEITNGDDDEAINFDDEEF